MPSPTEPRSAQSGSRRLFAVGALLAALAVVLGAFGTHALEGRLPPGLLATFETAVRYHLTQALGVLALALGAEWWERPALGTAGWLVVAGTVVFSGSLYLLVLTGVRTLGAVTPVGGVLLIAGWVAAALVLVPGASPRE